MSPHPAPGTSGPAGAGMTARTGGRPGGGVVALPQGVDPVLAAAARAAVGAYASARATHTREELAETVAMGADGTPTMRVDALVEARILEVTGSVNVLSEESGHLDRGSAVTLVMDPLDGSANGAAGVPLTAFSAALAIDGTFTEALTVWTDTGRAWWARPGAATIACQATSPAIVPEATATIGGRPSSPAIVPEATATIGGRPSSPAIVPEATATIGGRPSSPATVPETGATIGGRPLSPATVPETTPGSGGSAAGPAGEGRRASLGAGPAGVAVPCRTSGRRALDGAAVSLLRPHTGKPGPAAAWWAAASRAGRVRILSSSCLEAALVAEGATDAFADAATDTHRLVDLAAALVLLPAAGGAVRDVFGRPIEFDTDLTRRWSGVVAATPALADQLAETLRDAAQRA